MVGLTAPRLGIACSHRHRTVERALSRGGFAPLERRVVLALGAFGTPLGAFAILAVLPAV